MRHPRAFTLVELTVALALMAVLLGLVIVRFTWGSPRQQVFAEARKFGNLVETFRERALSEERLYALSVDMDAGTFSVSRPAERSAAWVARAPIVRSEHLNQAIYFKSANLNDQDIPSPVIIFLDARSVVPPMQWILAHIHGESVSIKLDPLQSEVSYEEH